SSAEFRELGFVGVEHRLCGRHPEHPVRFGRVGVNVAARRLLTGKSNDLALYEIGPNHSLAQSRRELLSDELARPGEIGMATVHELCEGDLFGDVIAWRGMLDLNAAGLRIERGGVPHTHPARFREFAH